MKTKWVNGANKTKIYSGKNYIYAYNKEAGKLLADTGSGINITLKVKDFVTAQQIVEALERIWL